jgi:hypothetical protein
MNLPARILLNVVAYGLHQRRDAPLGLAWGLLLCLIVCLFPVVFFVDEEWLVSATYSLKILCDTS